MRGVIFLLLTLVFISQGLVAKKKPRPSGPVYGHAGQVVFHSTPYWNLIKDRTDLYHSGDYVCTPGSEHYAPDCHTVQEWYQMKADPFIKLTLDDGTFFIFGNTSCLTPKLKHCDSELSDSLMAIREHLDAVPTWRGDGDTEPFMYSRSEAADRITIESPFGNFEFQK